ncbi:MAG: SMI1/KNR4 family protein [Planctomycetes bacterium]|nr:SMI1/KNR4 family protein [Planctomycetota bacterium]MCH9724926.1 SMI1/KNR4 family protein [Planctomycetota bacterium]MCH9776885.1 SMI1/KNR4 family protein [Planctomycetota bacterium]MCH9790952.1 SMI1/KNR4 family protein [Planctomycetota bacterium]
MHRFIESHIEMFAERINAIGGQWEIPVIEEPASEVELADIERQLQQPIPANFREFAATVSRRIYFDWRLPENFDLPESLDEIFSGGIDYDIKRLPDHEETRADWQKECFPNPENPYDKIWHNKIGFHHVPNGDCLALDSEGQIIYLSHDDGEGHGYSMAPSFPDLLKRWLPLGCPGPEDWQWLPFVANSISGIDPKCETAQAWITTISYKS